MNLTQSKAVLLLGLATLLTWVGYRVSTDHSPLRDSLRQVQWRPGILWTHWNRTRSQLPPRWQMQVPALGPPDWLSATDWLARQANDPEVAPSIVRTWSKWNPEARGLWLFWIQDRRQELSTEYLPLVRTELARDPKIGYRLLTTLARVTSLPPADIALLVHFLEQQIGVLEAQEQVNLLTQLAALDSLPPKVLMALAPLRQTSVPEVALIARVTLAQLAPAVFPLDANAEAQFRRLSHGEQTQLLTQLRAPEFQRAETPAWFRARTADLVHSYRPSATQETQDLKQLFAFLEGIGTSGARLADEIVPWVTCDNSEVRTAAARALIQLSPPTPELLTALLPHFAFDSATATILVWLAAHPTQAKPAESVVAQISQGNAPRATPGSPPPNPSRPLDPSQARRGSRGVGRPEGLELRCRPRYVPLPLLSGWPGYRSAHQETAALISDTDSDRFQRAVLSRLREVTFRELAEHCLAEIRTARNTPTDHPALPNGSDR